MKKIIILYDYFDPAYKAGGIIKSLKGLVGSLKDTYDFRILTSAYDLGTKNVLKGIRTNQWVGEDYSEIKYLTSKPLTYISLMNDIIKFKNETFYLNGIFSFKFFIFPLIIFQILGKYSGLVIAPRGMLQSGALGLKSRKKSIYISLLKRVPILKNATWHVTVSQESEDVRKTFGNRVRKEKIVLAQNISLSVKPELKMLTKVKYKVNFTTVALIVEMKNHLLFLQILLKSRLEWDITYNIYGPIHDRQYWEKCLKIIHGLPNNVKVNYHGFINPNQIEKAFEDNHFFVLPTKGENFGHAILEALTFGKPVVLSDKTPWMDVEEKHCGWIFRNEAAFFDILKTCVDMEDIEYQKMSSASVNHAKNFVKSNTYLETYTKLFN